MIFLAFIDTLLPIVEKNAISVLSSLDKKFQTILGESLPNVDNIVLFSLGAEVLK